MKIRIEISEEEFIALNDVAERDFRPLADEVRYILIKELRRRSVLPAEPENPSEARNELK